MDFMKKYIHIAKAIKPQLTQEASDIIATEYTKLRDFDLEQSEVARVSFFVYFILFYYQTNFFTLDSTRHCSYLGNANPSVDCSRPSSSFDDH